MADDRARGGEPTESSAPGQQAQLLTAYTTLRDDLADALDVTLFPFYGTLLGAVREHGFLPADTNFDTAYISGHSEPDKVRQEFKDLCHVLLERGYNIEAETTHAWVTVPSATERIGIYFAWFTPDGTFDASYGYHGTPMSRTAEFFEMRTEKLAGVDVSVPRNAENILAQLYGPQWRTPDLTFEQDTPARKYDNGYLLATGDVTELHWSQFYRDHAPDGGSPFAEFVADRFVAPGAVVEFGCGSGRDGIYFAHRGWRAFACDRSPEAITRANEVLRASGGLPAQFAAVDAGSHDEVTEYLDAHRATLDSADPLVIYLRFFLHAIDEAAQESLLDTLTGAIARDFYLCAEFRTVDDRNLAKHHGQHYRRYIDHENLAEQLSDRWGFVVEHLEAGQGLSPYDGEDPFLGRIVAVRRTG